MSLSIEDLKPQNFKITVKGVELECKPLKLSHTLIMASVGAIFNDIKNSSVEDIKRAEKEVNSIIPELIPELTNVELDGSTTMDVITQMMASVKPSDVQFLEKNGVELNSDPKAEKAG